MNKLFSLCLAANLVFAQAAVGRDSWFGIDKIKHFFMSAFIESVSFSVLQAAHVKRRPALIGAIGVTAAVGVAREIHDKRTPGKWFSYRDLTWDALGIAGAAAVLTRTIK
ncbi:MAG: VanZ family protein [Gemmatimonadota bacterium]|nr:VanZ family protein [Gemmatimonadota bacterium]